MTRHKWRPLPEKSKQIGPSEWAHAEICDRCKCYRIIFTSDPVFGHSPGASELLGHARIRYKTQWWNPFSVTDVEPPCK